jgi:hypothetical protein
MIMKSVSARFDEGKVLFDEEIVIPPHARLLVTILEDSDADRSDFLTLSSASFADAYDDDEIEYSEADVRR